jgi:hypothetical protein
MHRSLLLKVAQNKTCTWNLPTIFSPSGPVMYPCLFCQILQPQLEFRAWRDGGSQGGGGGLRPTGHPPEDNAAQLPRLSRQDPEGGLPRDPR